MATANPNPCTRPNPNHYPNPNSNPEPNQAWTPRVIKTSVVSHSPRYATATAPLANLLEEFRQAMESSGEMLSRRREQARRSVRPLRSRSGTPRQASRARAVGRARRHCGRCGHVPACAPWEHATPTKARGVCMRPQVWEHASVEMLERLAAAPEVQDLVDRLGARAAAGEISVSQAGSATVDHLVKFAGSPLASSTSEPS